MTETLLLAPQNYNGRFLTVNYIADRGWQLTYWSWGNPTGHETFNTMSEAWLKGIELGYSAVTSEATAGTFEEDVLMAANMVEL